MSKRRRGLFNREVKTVPILPTILTLGNLGCGFAAIVMATKNNFLAASWLIFLGMVFDTFDGKVARMTNQTGKFGEELDSLADIVTFGVAPAFLLKTFLPIHEKIGWMIALLYVFCAALRLARYNVESAKTATYYFSGLPSPAAAGALASLILVQLEFNLPWIRFLMPMMFVVLGAVMVSRVKYMHLANKIFGGRKSFTFLIELLFVFVVLILWKEASLAILFNGYAFGGLIYAGFAYMKNKNNESNISPNPDNPDKAANNVNNQ